VLNPVDIITHRR